MLRGPTPVPATSTDSSPVSSRTTTSSVKSSESGVPRLDQLDPALLGHMGAVDQVDGLLGVAGEDPDERGDAEDPRVLIGQAASELHLDAVGRTLPQRLGQPAELLAERHEGGELLHHLGANRGDVDGSRHDAAAESRGHLLGRDHAGAVLRLGGGGAEVRA